MIQIWYSLPKKKKEHFKNWEALKNCVTISNREDASVPKEFAGEYSPVTKTHQGWFCHHPENKLHVLFETFPLITCNANTDMTLLHQLKFDGLKEKGFFFVKWDQEELDQSGPYQTHLDEMAQEIKNLEPSQVFSQSPILPLFFYP